MSSLSILSPSTTTASSTLLGDKPLAGYQKVKNTIWENVRNFFLGVITFGGNVRFHNRRLEKALEVFDVSAAENAIRSGAWLRCMASAKKINTLMTKKQVESVKFLISQAQDESNHFDGESRLGGALIEARDDRQGISEEFNKILPYELYKRTYLHSIPVEWGNGSDNPTKWQRFRSFLPQESGDGVYRVFSDNP